MSVFHLKYRPQNLTELDLSDVAESIGKIMSSKERPQAYLFAGPKGSGKTSAARIVAKMVNCEKSEGGDPCNRCNACKEINGGNSLDVMEIDAASHRGIEDVRELKDKAFLLPVKLKVKVFIIDEVHMLTKEAFNALLKLIEEPPKNTLFIMCTTDPQKVPETVLSRLVRVDFRRATKEEKIKSLKRVIEGEKLKVDKKMLEIIVNRSDSSFRNLQKNFNELVMAVGEELDEAAVDRYFTKKTGDYLMEDLEQDLAEGNLKEILIRMEKMVEVGVDFKDYRERVLNYFQQKLLISLGVTDGEKSKLSTDRLNQWLTLLIAVAKQERDTDIGQLPIELAVVEFLGEDKSPKEEIKVEKVEIQEQKQDTAVSVQVEELESMWGKLLVTVKPYNHSVEAFLRAARPHRVENGVVVLEVFYPFHKDKLEEPKNREIVEKGLAEVLGMKVALKCILGKSKKPTLVINNDTPMEKVTGEEKKDIYDVAKEIFG